MTVANDSISLYIFESQVVQTVEYNTGAGVSDFNLLYNAIGDKGNIGLKYECGDHPQCTHTLAIVCPFHDCVIEHMTQ